MEDAKPGERISRASSSSAQVAPPQAGPREDQRENQRGYWVDDWIYNAVSLTFALLALWFALACVHFWFGVKFLPTCLSEPPQRVLPSFFDLDRNLATARVVDFTYLSRHCADIPPISANAFYMRQQNLIGALRSVDAAAYISEPGPNAFYYANVSSSDWHVSERPLLIVFAPPQTRSTNNDAQVIVLTPKFEASRSKLMAIPALGAIEYVEWAEDEDPYEILAHRLASVMTKPRQRIVLDEQMRLFVANGLRRAGLHDPTADEQDDGLCGAAVKQVRERKSKEELQIMQCVNEVTLLAVRAVREYMYVGMKESEADTLITKALRDAGIAKHGVFITTQFGENAALPHGGGSDKTLGLHDFATFDVGGTLHGYWSDVTRTFALPESQIPSKHLEIWAIVKSAQEAALEAAEEGVAAEQADHAARLVIGRSGYGEQFTHRLGHGIGLEIHESPYLRGGYKSRLQKGNTFSDEPGIYIEGRVGVRLEDCFVIGEDGKGVLLTEEVGGAARSPWMP